MLLGMRSTCAAQDYGEKKPVSACSHLCLWWQSTGFLRNLNKVVGAPVIYIIPKFKFRNNSYQIVSSFLLYPRNQTCARRNTCVRERARLGKRPYHSITTAPRFVLILNLLPPVLKNAFPR